MTIAVRLIASDYFGLKIGSVEVGAYEWRDFSSAAPIAVAARQHTLHKGGDPDTLCIKPDRHAVCNHAIVFIQ